MKLTEMSLKQFIAVVASDAPAPGGGSIAALEGSLGIALIHMVAGLTVGKKKYAAQEELMRELMSEGFALCNQLADAVDLDTEAFNEVSAVFAMPKETEEQKAARSEAMQKALVSCTITPYETMCMALAALRIGKRAVGTTNETAASDLGVGALSLKAAVHGAWLNVLINIGGIKDQAFAEKYRSEGQAIIDEANLLADEIYAAVLKSVS